MTGDAMDALDRFLTARDKPLCGACCHARATARDGLYCHRIAGTPYPCQVERASSALEAWLYGACGRHGRFFEPTAGSPAWIARDARPNTAQERIFG
jgi:hypothetical protein